MELAIAPVRAHLGVDDVLVDGGQLVRQAGIELLDDLRISLHGRLLILRKRDLLHGIVRALRGRVKGSLERAVLD